MSPRYFSLSDDVHFPGRWHLATPLDSQGQEVDDWQFSEGKPLQLQGRLRVPVEHTGRPLDFSEAGIKVPVIHARLAPALLELAPTDVQIIPVEVEGHPDQYFILVATRLIRCIDEKASRVQFWTPEDGAPHKVGTYYAVDDLRIDKARVGSARVFRPEGWPGTLIISEDIKNAWEHARATGAKFTEV